MKKLAMPFMALALVAMLSSSSWGHKPEGVEFFAPHIPDELIPEIDGNSARLDKLVPVGSGHYPRHAAVACRQ